MSIIDSILIQIKFQNMKQIVYYVLEYLNSINTKFQLYGSDEGDVEVSCKINVFII